MWGTFLFVMTWGAFFWRYKVMGFNSLGGGMFGRWDVLYEQIFYTLFMDK